MPNFNGNFISIVCIGRHNPQILNHDFLVSNEIISVKEEPFKTLFAKEGNKPFSEFVSTPVLTTIKYDSISIVIEDSRFQIKDTNYGDPATSPIISITKKYFGEILRYTPLNVGGINLNGIITFDDEKDEQKFDESLGIKRDPLCTYTGTKDIRLGMAFTFQWLEGLVDVQIPKSRGSSNSCTINFNYEFKDDNLESFLGNLDKVELINEKFKELLQSLNVKANHG